MANSQDMHENGGQRLRVSAPTYSSSDLAGKLKAAPPNLTQGLVELLIRLQSLEEENSSLRLDLQDQTAGRKQWQERARKTEQRQAANPYLITVINGNDLCFRNRLVQAGTAGAEEAARVLTKEIREHAHAHHKNDLPRTIAVVVYIFLSIEKLSYDLLAAEAIQDQKDLHVFIRSLASQTGVYINDCNALAVPTRVQETYELHLENCHCQHVILALGPSSGYYATLAEYADDEYTKTKTSLIRPGGGFPEYELPFHLAQLSVMHDVPLIPLNGDTISELYPAPVQRPHRTDNRPPPKPESFTSAIVNHAPQSLSTTRSSDSPQSPFSTALSSDPSSQTSHPCDSSPDKSLHQDTASQAQSPSPTSPVGSGVKETTASHDRSAGASSRSSARSRHQSAESPSRQQDWEIDTQLSKLPDTLPTNRSGNYYEREQERAQKHAPAVLAVKKNNQTSHLKPTSKSSPRAPTFSGMRYRPARHSPERDGRSYAAPHGPPGRRAAGPVQWVPELPIRNNILRNQYGQRLDEAVPCPSNSDFADFSSRKARVGKMCNEQHLTGGCTYEKGSESGLRPPHACVYNHSPIPVAVLRVLLYHSRSKPCPAKGRCEDFGCILGHHCTHELHSFKKHGRQTRCPWADVPLQDNEPDPSQTIHYQPVDASIGKFPQEREVEAETPEPALLLDPDVW